MTKYIPLTQGQFALVDDDDYEWLSQYSWQFTTTGYARRSEKHGRGRAARVVQFLMHREILGISNAGRSVFTDHINHDTLDNRKANLRICDSCQNQGNRIRQGGTSWFRGVRFVPTRITSPWRATLTANGAKLHLGCFAREEAAAEAYDQAALVHFGEFASLNFPEGARRRLSGKRLD